MDDNGIQKTWEQPWSTEEMRANCSNWNLAGDAGLLKHLQEFSQNLLQKTHTTEVALDSLLEDMRNTSVDVQNATNALLMLSNNQFVENRVYDDCEEEKDETEVKPDKDNNKPIDGMSEASLIAKAAEAILLGMSVIDTKFECVEVPASDSEGEEELESGDLRYATEKKSFALVLEPKNPYTCRPLPYLIGSKEFMEDDRIGLVDEEDDEEEEEEEIAVSMGEDLVAQGIGNDSGSSLAADIVEEGLFVDEDEVDERRASKVLTKQNWESSSSNASDDIEVENNRIRKKQKKDESSREHIGPYGGNAEEGEQDIFGKESSSDDEFLGGTHVDVFPTLSVKKQPDEIAFAEELAAKLGAVDPKKVDSVLTKPKKKKKEAEGKTENAKLKTKSKTPSISSDNLFGPPKDEWNADEDADSIFVDPYGMFSGGRGLFDDLSDPILDAKPSNFPSSTVPPNLSDKPPPLKKEPSLFGGNDNIFGDDKDDDERDMFADILVKMKPPDKSKTLERKTIPDEFPESNLVLSGKTVLQSSNSWLFDDDGVPKDDPLKKDEVLKVKQERLAEERQEKKKVVVIPKKDALLQCTEDGKKVGAEKKVVAGACSLYANGIDPFALGENVVKEIQEKTKVEMEDDEDLFSTAKAPSKTVTPKVAPKPVMSAPSEKESLKEPKCSPRSLFDDIGEGDDLFSSVTSKGSKDLAANDSDGFFGDDLFTPKKMAAAVISDKLSEKDKNLNVKKGGADIGSRGLFGDSGSDDEDIFSCSSSLGSRSSGSKVVPSKSTKVFSDPASSLFGDDYDQQADIFSGALGKISISERKEADDLFKDVVEDNSQSGLLNVKKEVVIDSKKINQNVPLTNNVCNKDDDIFSESVTKASSGKKIRVVLEELLVPGDNVIENSVSTKKAYVSKHKKIDILSDDLHSGNDIFSSPLVKEADIDDIFGKSDDKLEFDIGKNEISDTEKGSNFISVEVAADKEKDMVVAKSDMTKVFKDLFEESKEIDSDHIFSSKNPSKNTSQQETPSPAAVVVSKLIPPMKKAHSKDLFAEFDSNNDNTSAFAIPNIKEENRVDSLSRDPLGREDDLFSSQKLKAVSKKVIFPTKEKSPELFPESKTKAMVNVFKDDVKAASKEAVKKTGRVGLEDEKKSHVLPPVLASNTRKSPPRTLNLGKVIPSPKLGHNLSDTVDDFFGSNNAEEDRIVEAWMKGQPPPLRDSKVENTMEDLSNYHLDGYAAAKTNVHNDGDSSYFGDIPAGSLLRSHGKERARIQNRRRPPSRKVRKTQTTAANVDHLHRLEEEGVTATIDISPVVPTEPPPSKGSMEEDRGSQGTVEEWSTPEAALTSPSSSSAVLPPRSNPLSPSTDEEQDFFDVLPVGRYPPPMGPPESSPFSDALNSNVPVGVGNNLWDKDNGRLFEDAGNIMVKKGYDTLWASPDAGIPTCVADGIQNDNLFGEISKSDAPKSLLGKPSVEAVNAMDRVSDDDHLFSVGGANFSEGTLGKGNNVVSRKMEVVKKEEKLSGKKEGKDVEKRKRGEVDDELWGDGRFTSGSKLKNDLFSKGSGELEGTGDLDDLFQGQDDLFGSSKMSSSQASGKGTIGIAGSKNIGKSLSKLPPKAKNSLFDDEEDDTEDLFSPHPSKSGPVQSVPSKRVSANKNEKKTKHISASGTNRKSSNPGDSLFEDPLMVLKRKD